MVKSPLDFLNKVDDKLRIYAAQFKEKIPEKNFSEVLNALSFSGTVGGTFILGWSSQISLAFAPIKSLDTMDIYYSSVYEIFKMKRGKNGEMTQKEAKLLKYTRISRKANIAGAAFYVAKPLYEILTMKTAENPVADFAVASMLFSSAFSMYLKDTDDEGLKKKREAKLEKELEKSQTAHNRMGIENFFN